MKQWFGVLWILFCMGACADQPKEKEQKLNEIQIIGSHNSYKIRMDQALLAIVGAQDAAMAASLDYTHISLTQQLDLGLRNLEFDVFHDPIGGRYSSPLGINLLKDQGLEAQPFDPNKDLAKPGLKMFHIQDIDFRSHHLLFKAGLEEVKQWSDAHPDHLPIFITINTKDQKIPKPGFTQPLPFNTTALDSLDLEIQEVLKDKLITPDLVRGKYPSLKEALQSKGWPSINQVRGKFMFILDEGEPRITAYIAGHPMLENRAMFVLAKEDSPNAAVMIRNYPKRDFKTIKRLVKKGFLVRTRADADTKEARLNDLSTFKAAKESGAHIITTDYYIPEPKWETGYKVQFKGGVYERPHLFYQTKQ